MAPLAFNLMLEEDPKVNRLVRALILVLFWWWVAEYVPYRRAGGLYHFVETDMRKPLAEQDNAYFILEQGTLSPSIVTRCGS